MIKKNKKFLYPIKNHPGSFATNEGEIYSTHSGTLKIKKEGTAGGYKWSFTAGQPDEQCKKILLNVCKGKYKKREELGDIE